ncbi:hypothetical protein [Nocardia salmonicida]|uniref:hypothetical protein n=1 Tax=Nocardia salmonicida TaxID=53431 RepID=UPI0033FF2F0C
MMTVLEEVMVESATEAMLSNGFAPRPQVHIFDRTRAQPVVGYVVSRFYSQGDDAASAIANLGVLAAALCATDLIVFWEESDLRTSIHGAHPTADYPTGLVTLRVTHEGHDQTWRPFSNRVLGYQQNGLPIVQPLWGTVATESGGDIPFPIQGLLGRWRATTGHTEGADALLDMAEDEGYEILLVAN